MGTFDVTATFSNPARPELRLTLDLLVDTGASWTLLPDDIVRRLDLVAPSRRSVALARGEQVTYQAGQVVIELGGEQMTSYAGGVRPRPRPDEEGPGPSPGAPGR